MQFLPLYIASILATLVAAAPLSGCRISTITTEVVEKRGQADLETYDGDECTGNSWGLVMLAGPDTYRCVAMSNAKSIRIANSDCRATMWSGADCAGSSFVVLDSECHSGPFSSVSLQC